MTSIKLTAAERSLKGLPGSARDIYDWLLALKIASQRSNRGAWTMPRQAVIAERTGWCIRTVGHAIAELRRRGLIITDPRYYNNAAGHIRRASNRVFVFVATNAFAVARSIASGLKRRRSTVSADICRAGASTKAQKQETVFPAKGNTVFLRAWEARNR